MATNNIMLEVAAKTNTGRVREANEDNFVVTQDSTHDEWIVPKEPYLNSEAGTVLVVADGMGGLNAGEVASKIAVDSVKEELTKLTAATVDDKDIKQLLINIITNAHKKIVSTGKSNPETEGMGSTIVMAWIKDDKVHVGWVGDSRCYVCRNGKLLQLSKDHSYVQSLVDKGEITKDQAFLHPESNIITQSLGDADHSPKPDYTAFSLANDDVFLLCSDGLNSMVRDEIIEKTIVENNGLAEGAQMLIEAANNEGGHDNITVLLAKVISGAATALPFQKKDEEINDSKIQRHPAVKKLKKTNRFLLYILLLVSVSLAAYFVAPILSKSKTGKSIKPKNDTPKLRTDSITLSRPPIKQNLSESTSSKVDRQKDSNKTKIKTGGNTTQGSTHKDSTVTQKDSTLTKLPQFH